jgi:hypothetical protein
MAGSGWRNLNVTALECLVPGNVKHRFAKQAADDTGLPVLYGFVVNTFRA